MQLNTPWVEYTPHDAYNANPVDGGFESSFYTPMPVGTRVDDERIFSPGVRASETGSWTVFDWMEDEDGLGLTDLRLAKVYAHLYRHHVDYGGAFPINQANFAQTVNMSRQTVNKLINELIDRGLLMRSGTHVDTPGGGKRRGVNVYRVLQQPINDAHVRITARKNGLIIPQGHPALATRADDVGEPAGISVVKRVDNALVSPSGCNAPSPEKPQDSPLSSALTTASDAPSAPRAPAKAKTDCDLPGIPVVATSFTCEDASGALDFLKRLEKGRKNEKRIYINKNIYINNSSIFSLLSSSKKALELSSLKGANEVGSNVVALTEQETVALANIVASSTKTEWISGSFLIDTAKALHDLVDDGMKPSWVVATWKRYINENRAANEGGGEKMIRKYEKFPATWMRAKADVKSCSIRLAAQLVLDGRELEDAPEDVLLGYDEKDYALVAESSFREGIPSELVKKADYKARQIKIERRLESNKGAVAAAKRDVGSLVIKPEHVKVMKVQGVWNFTYRLIKSCTPNRMSGWAPLSLIPSDATEQDAIAIAVEYANTLDANGLRRS